MRETLAANKETTSPSTKRVKRQKGVMRETLAPYKGTGLRKCVFGSKYAFRCIGIMKQRLAAIDDNEPFSITTI